jgi:hypothetical protein
VANKGLAKWHFCDFVQKSEGHEALSSSEGKRPLGLLGNEFAAKLVCGRFCDEDFGADDERSRLILTRAKSGRNWSQGQKAHTN